MGPSKALDWGLVLVQVLVRLCCSWNLCLALVVESHCLQVVVRRYLYCSLSCPRVADPNFRSVAAAAVGY